MMTTLLQKLRTLLPSKTPARRSRRTTKAVDAARAARLRWWVLFNAIVAGWAIAAYEGGAAFMWRADATHISVITWILFGVLTGFIGYLTSQQAQPGRDEQQDRRFIHGCWFAAEALMGLGLLGTVTGVLTMFEGSVGGLDPGNVAAMRASLLQLSHGLTIAFTTTLSGIGASLLAKIQLVSYDLNNPNAPKDG